MSLTSSELVEDDRAQDLLGPRHFHRFARMRYGHFTVAAEPLLSPLCNLSRIRSFGTKILITESHCTYPGIRLRFVEGPSLFLVSSAWGHSGDSKLRTLFPSCVPDNPN